MNVMDRITVNPRQCGGRPCIRGMRIRVTDVLDLLAAGLSREQVIEELPDLEPEDVDACLRFASRRIDHPASPSGTGPCSAAAFASAAPGMKPKKTSIERMRSP